MRTLAATLRLRAGRTAEAYGAAGGSTITGPVADAMPTRFQLRAGDLDAALRYEAVLRLLAERSRPSLRVLEVGSGPAESLSSSSIR